MYTKARGNNETGAASDWRGLSGLPNPPKSWEMCVIGNQYTSEISRTIESKWCVRKEHWIPLPDCPKEENYAVCVLSLSIFNAAINHRYTWKYSRAFLVLYWKHISTKAAHSKFLKSGGATSKGCLIRTNKKVLDLETRRAKKNSAAYHKLR